MTDKLSTIKEISDVKSYVTDTKDNHRKDIIEIGDTKQNDVFYPQAKFMQWDNETNFSIRLSEDVTGSSNEIVDGKVIWKSSDQKKECHLYELDSTSCFNCEDGGFEIEVVLYEKPKSNIIEYTLQTKGLDFFYQPELTEEEIEAGYERPDNVIGSYAVYHKTKKNDLSKVGGKNYRTGKAFHIYRPLAVDSNDSTSWCILDINEKDEILSITIPQEFIDKAIYPIKIDPTMGYTSIGFSGVSTSNIACWTKGTTDSNGGVVSQISVYCGTNSGNFKAVMYEHHTSTGDWDIITDGIGNSVSITSTTQWYHATYTTKPAVSPSTNYSVGGVFSNSSIRRYVDSGSYYDGSAGARENGTYSSPESLDVYSQYTTNNLVSIYATYAPIVPELRSYKLHYYKDETIDIPLWDYDVDMTHSVGVYYNSEKSYAELTTVGAANASDLMVRKDGVTYAFVTDSTGGSPPVTAFAEAWILEDTASASNVNLQSGTEKSLSGTPTAQGDWSGQWSSPDLTVPNDGLYLFGYSDFLRESGTTRAVGTMIFCTDTGSGTTQVTTPNGASSHGYIRDSGGADYAARQGLFFADLNEDDIVLLYEGGRLDLYSDTDYYGDYDRSSGDPRGMWALNLKGAGDYLISNYESDATPINGSGCYSNSPRPIDLGTPSSLSSGTWADVTWDSDVSSSGSTITRSSNTFTVAANSKVLCYMSYAFLNSSGGRRGLIMRMDIDGSPYAYSSIYSRNASSNSGCGQIVMPIITGGSSVSVTFKFVNQEESNTTDVQIQGAEVAFIDMSDQDICLLGKTDSDITSIVNSPQIISFPVGDEIQVDTDTFDHPSANTSRITNDAGEEITVLAGFTVFTDRSATTSGTRKYPMTQINKNGTQLDYAIGGEFSRGQQSSDDCFVAGYSYCAPVVMSASDYIEMDIYDLSSNSGSDLIVNCTDGCAIYFWAIKIS